MKLNKGWTLVLWLLVATMFVATAIAQETTAGMQGTVKDPQGAVVSKAVVEVTSPALIGVKKLETDASGYYRFANLPPGAYTVTVSAQGFRTLKQTGIALEVGKLPTIELVLQVGGTEQTIEVSSAAPLVDVTQSKVQTVVSQETIAAVPKGRSFTSLIQFAPGARNEVLQGDGTGASGYQIDGATNSENSYLVEGQETASIRTGATTVDVPMEFIQEVQIKTSGFEAEYGGALGGVVNVIQKRGGNAWHGSVFTSYRGDFFNASPSRYARKNPDVQIGQAGPRLDQPLQYYQPVKDHFRILDPGFELSGYVKKDRLWVFTSFAPDFSTLRRTVTFVNAPVNGVRSFNQDQQTYFGLARADYLATKNIRVYGSWQLGYQRRNGNALPNAEDAYGMKNSSRQNNADAYNYGIGYVAPNVIYGSGADITITPNLVATTRWGYTFEDYQDRGLPVGIRYIYRSSNYNYPGVATSATTTALDGTVLPTSFVHTSGYYNIGANSAYLYDKYRRTGFSQDAAYFKKGLGTHNFKVGYGFYKLGNSTINGYNTAQAYIAYNTPYYPLSINQSACAAITAYNQTQGWGNRAPGTNGATDPGLVGGVSPSDAASGKSCTGLWGTVNYREYGETGDVSSMNHSLYAQDAWTIGQRLTLNVGVRFDKEHLPSYAPGLPGIDFSFGQKFAPRLGGSYDLLGNGKLKVYGSFGYFYDIMKYELPRGSFGGNYWHDCVYAMDTYDWTQLLPQRGSNGHFCPKTGEANGTFLSGGQRFIENQDYRTYSNDPNQDGAYASGLIDPNLKPMKQHEMVVGADWALSSSLALETRYSRKRLDRTIEDAGIQTPFGEQFYIINPGEGIHVQPVPTTDCTNCPTQPKASRRYDGLEIRLVKRPVGRWFATISYTYSKLAGNYSGLTATDVSDSGATSPGRVSPNVDRAFDEPYMQFNAHGQVVDGPLPTDRPNTFKAYGYYRLKWWGHETMLGAYQQWYQGSPLSSYMNIDGAPVFVENRGKFVNMTQDAAGNWVPGSITNKRGANYSQTDLSLVQEFHISKTNERLVAGFEANVINVFNQKAPTVYGQELTAPGQKTSPDIAHCCSDWKDADGVTHPGTMYPDSVSGTDYQTLMTGYNYVDITNLSGAGSTVNGALNSYYGQPVLFQAGRQMRFKLRFSF